MRDRAAIHAAHLVTVRAASVRTGIPKRTLYHWAQHGKIWSIMVGDRIMLHEEDVRDLELRRVS